MLTGESGWGQGRGGINRCVCVRPGTGEVSTGMCKAWDVLLTGESRRRRYQPVCVCVRLGTCCSLASQGGGGINRRVCGAWHMLLTDESGWGRYQPACV